MIAANDARLNIALAEKIRGAPDFERPGQGDSQPAFESRQRQQSKDRGNGIAVSSGMCPSRRQVW